MLGKHERELDVFSVGMLNLDIVAQGFLPAMANTKSSPVGPITFQTGGDTQNCALTQARLGVRVAICASIGSDPAGDICRGELEKAGVNCAWLRRKSGATGLCIDLIRPDNEATFLFHPGENATLSLDDVAWDAVGKARVVSLHSLFYCGRIEAAELFRKARSFGCVTLADTVIMDSTETIDLIADALPHLDYFMPSLAELELMTRCPDPESGARQMLARGVKNVVVKLGHDGCLFMNGEQTLRVPGFAVKAVDTTGAGDNFIAGFLYGLTNDMGIADALRFGNACGAITVGEVGSNGAVRSAAQVEDFIRAHS